jgi:hypothetical protein
MVFTDAGMVKFPVKPIHDSKAEDPIYTTVAGIVKLPILAVGHTKSESCFLLNKTPLFEEYLVFVVSTEKAESCEQP